ncbi:MAG TPA: 3-hydroxyacyl-CoA dehydrogenase NAD-binding domain-containing protein [Azospirillum sp.]|nr:3-hydroxyacyl-CoA dehydrogenase NAD-binding domain-containing protein [Azospirillum sp.]
MQQPDAVKRVAVVGAGTIGASWTAQFLARGLTVAVSDPNPAAEDFVRAYVEKAWPALERLGLTADADPAAWRFHADPRAAVAGAEFVQESGPENADIKRALYAQIEDALDDSAILASSTSGLIMSELQQDRRRPERFVVGHPFNPPHLIPLVEVVGGSRTAPETIDWAMGFYRAIGKRPIRLNREVPGHLANRLQAALWREAVHAVASGIASVEDVDLAISEGPGLRWAFMGPHMIFNLGGGAGGMEHFLHHLGPNIETWWRDLGTPSLTPEVTEKLVAGCREAAHGRSNAELAGERDRLLMALLETLRRERGHHQ